MTSNYSSSVPLSVFSSRLASRVWPLGQTERAPSPILTLGNGKSELSGTGRKPL